jgi:tetratricopeptide (TPR) repeat protein
MSAQRLTICGVAILVLCGTAIGVHAQQGESSSKTPLPGQTEPAERPGPESTAAPAADQPKWDPLRAENDIEVGKYYLNKGDVDAAVDRFNDAIVYKPGWGLPFRYLGEAQEKKGLKKQAAKAYTRYLDLTPHAEDGAKVRKKLDKLWAQIDKEKK